MTTKRKERAITMFSEVTGECFKVYKGYFIGDKGSIYNYNLRKLTSPLINIDGYSYRISALIADLHGLKPLKAQKKKKYKIHYKDNNKQNKSIENMYYKPSKGDSYKLYRKEVDRLTNMQPLHLMKDFDKRDFNKYHIDHIIPVKTCYNKGIKPEECANIKNLQILTRQENTFKKGNKAYSVIKQCEHIKNIYEYYKNH